MRNHPSEEGQRWLSQAKEDLKWANHLANEGGYHIACFLAQQVTEKALKAYLYSQGIEFVFGHSVAKLSSQAAQYHPGFVEKAGRWSLLDTYYIPTRYPNGLPDGIPAKVYTQDAARGAVSLADEAVSYIDQLLSVE